MYEIHVDMDKRLLSDKLIGFWDIATAERFSAEYRAAVRKLAAAGPGWKIWADHEDFEIQPLEVTAILSELAAYVEANGLAKAAVYMPGALHRLQIKRTVGSAKIQIFASKKEAQAWLDG
jgi:hypothetical protein